MQTCEHMFSFLSSVKTRYRYIVDVFYHSVPSTKSVLNSSGSPHWKVLVKAVPFGSSFSRMNFSPNLMIMIIMMMVIKTNQPQSTLPLLSGGMPAQPDPDAKGSGGDKEGVVGVEVVLREVALLHQLGLHGPGDVADPKNDCNGLAW